MEIEYHIEASGPTWQIVIKALLYIIYSFVFTFLVIQGWQLKYYILVLHICDVLFVMLNYTE